MAGRHSDVLLCWIEPLEAMITLLERAQSHYAGSGRVPRFGLRTHLVVRDTEADAWRAAEDLLSRVDPRVEAQRAAAVSGTPMVGAAAQARRLEDDRLGKHLWNGISRVRVNLGTAIVGTPDQVAGELASYWRVGFDEFILSGFPHREEAVRIAREVIPRVRQQTSG
jgi:alkanesulfonate monooxygenase